MSLLVYLIRDGLVTAIISWYFDLRPPYLPGKGHRRLLIAKTRSIPWCVKILWPIPDQKLLEQTTRRTQRHKANERGDPMFVERKMR